MDDVTYGNVGAPRRLDFTVIGNPANVAARLSDRCKALEQPLLLSAEVARHASDGLRSMGEQSLRNVGQDIEVFAIAGEAFG